MNRLLGYLEGKLGIEQGDERDVKSRQDFLFKAQNLKGVSKYIGSGVVAGEPFPQRLETLAELVHLLCRWLVSGG